MADFIQTLVSAVVGGLMVLGSQLVLEHRKQETEKKRKKAEKLEELASALYAQEHWLIQLQNTIKEGETTLETIIAKLPPPPFAKLQAISNVYFPEFQDDVNALSLASAKFVFSVLHREQLNRDPLTDSYATYIKLIRRLEDLIRDYAKREF